MQFTKMQASGNDFIILNLFKNNIQINFAAFAKKYCDRHFGIGADGIIIVLPSKKADFTMKIFNADGSEAEMCGNGIRCFAKYVFEKKLTAKKEITVETKAGIIKPKLIIKNKKIKNIKVNMGQPKLKRKDIPLLGNPNEEVINYQLSISNYQLAISCVSMGNPHCIIFVDNINQTPVKELGPLIENHKLFPKKTNVEFVEVVNKKNLKVKVWERGVGETLACGTAACAVTVAAVLNNKTLSKVTLQFPGGKLFVEWKKDKEIYLTGNAVEVFKGEVTKSNYGL